MWQLQKCLQISLTALIVAVNLQESQTESRVYNTGYGLGAPINVGGESPFGLSSSLGSSIGGSNNFGLSSGLSGLQNGIGLGSFGGGLGYSLSANNYPNNNFGLNNFNGFQNNPFAQHHGGLFTSSNFGNSFYPGSGAYFGQNFGGFGLQRPFNTFGSGLGNFGLQASNGIGNGLSSGYPLNTAFTGLGSSSLGGFGSPYSSGLNFGSQHFK